MRKVCKFYWEAGVMLFAFLLCGCKGARAGGMVNELHFPLERITEITISYDEEQITFFEGEQDELVIKEYMTVDKKKYYAKVDQGKSSIKISEGGKPFFKKEFERRVEVYLPQSYRETVAVTTTNGEIDLRNIQPELDRFWVESTSGQVSIGQAKANDICLSTTSGEIQIGTIQADQIQITTTQGNIGCEKICGKVTYKTTSGNIEIMSAEGEGSYKAENSGEIKVTYREVAGDLSFYNKNGNIELQIPESLGFYFLAATKNGTIKTDFQESIKMNEDTAEGMVGYDSGIEIKLETKNGDMEVCR